MRTVIDKKGKVPNAGDVRKVIAAERRKKTKSPNKLFDICWQTLSGKFHSSSDCYINLNSTDPHYLWEGEIPIRSIADDCSYFVPLECILAIRESKYHMSGYDRYITEYKFPSEPLHVGSEKRYYDVMYLDDSCVPVTETMCRFKQICGDEITFANQFTISTDAKPIQQTLIHDAKLKDIISIELAANGNGWACDKASRP